MSASWVVIFLSTLSARRATNTQSSCGHLALNFYPRSPRGERLPQTTGYTVIFLFLSTLSARRATIIDITKTTVKIEISIHALREESDVINFIIISFLQNFYPRSPRGERQAISPKLSKSTRFLSTLSARRATGKRPIFKAILPISIHALREESDATPLACQCQCQISIHALREESDATRRAVAHSCCISIHALREESDSLFFLRIFLSCISIHALREESDGLR